MQRSKILTLPQYIQLSLLCILNIFANQLFHINLSKYGSLGIIISKERTQSFFQ